jgi:hypothetical protein
VHGAAKEDGALIEQCVCSLVEQLGHAEARRISLMNRIEDEPLS